MKNVSEHLKTLIPDGQVVTFGQWYESYPKKANRKRAEALWNRLSDEKKEKATIDVPIRHERHSQWKDRNFIPAPDVYLRNEKWNDDIVEARTVEQEQAELDDGSNLSRFWTLFKQTYGNERVKREYGETMPFIWQKALDGLTKREIAKIINYLMNDTERGLPDLTKIKRIRRIGREERFIPLEKPRNRELALEQLAKIREDLK